MPAEAAPAPKKNNKKLLLTAAAAIVLLAGGGGAAWFLSSNSADAAAKARATPLPAQYYALSPAFVVNLVDTDSVRYLQADVQLMTRDPETLAALELHTPAIRNRLLLLLGSQSSTALAERRGKETLQQQALAEVRSVLKAEKAPDKLEALYFTSLVTQ